MENQQIMPQEKYESDQLNELYTALSKAQGEMEIARKSKKNTYFGQPYADLTDVVDASRPALTSNSLSIIQRIVEKSDSTYLYTRLCHNSGQWIESTMKMCVPTSKVQDRGSYITYVRRYTYASICGVITDLDKAIDDDGEAAMASDPTNKDADKRTDKSNDALTKSQVSTIEKRMNELNVTWEMVNKEYANIQGSRSLTQSTMGKFLVILTDKWGSKNDKA